MNPDWKLFGACFNCKKKRFFIKKHSIQLPIGRIATPRELFCTTCAKLIKKGLETKI